MHTRIQNVRFVTAKISDMFVFDSHLICNYIILSTNCIVIMVIINLLSITVH